ncbi:Nramp family divalent metal transporter [Paractinoplanes atraurantiacus]|uniref:Manganese transport protein n=1 Tax=Paractinoplanes atraurantiacus TaxID=1036182 RepID=A0A285IIM4_9ACTN|nr:Nramp family divalent metal transporter [Actinoplanes atraurantiacus]SNY47818.1 manganese transport protein [Actinoplanes atraurantiacus]
MSVGSLVEVRARGRVRGRLALMGPALVAAIAYVDPGNVAANTQAGAETGYALIWVVVLASVIAMLVQYLSAKLGLATGRSLPEVCGEVLSRRMNIVMWVQSEIVAVFTDIAEFVGAALGLHLLFGVPLPLAGLVIGVASLLLLNLRERGVRRFEAGVAILLLLTAAGFAYTTIKLNRIAWPELGSGLTPSLSGDTALLLAAGLVGATVMPHAVYLHSALTEHRVTATSGAGRRYLLKFLRIDCLAGLGLAALVNIAMLVLAAELYSTHQGADSSIQTAHDLIGITLGAGAAVIFAGSLLTSGVASASVGTYAGQVVMAGFIGREIPVYARRLITMVPSLAVLTLGLPLTTALVASQAVLSFGVPFALIALVLVTRRRDLMGSLVNRPLTTAAACLASTLVILLNIGLLATLFT